MSFASMHNDYLTPPDDDSGEEGRDLISAAQLAIRAIDKRPILYTDSIKGEQTCRDDLWAITTAERDAIIAALNTAQPPAAQPVAWQLYKGGELYALKHQKDERSDFYTWVPLYRQPDPRIAQLEADLAAAQQERDSYMLLSKMRPAPMADMVPAEDLAAAQAERDGDWMDNYGACKLCDGEIPYGHTLECALYKIERERDSARAEAAALRVAFEWLEAKVFERKWNGVMGSGSRMDWFVAGNYRHVVQKLHGDTLIAAIDAARGDGNG